MIENCNLSMHDKECFACGIMNIQGLNLSFQTEAQGFASTVFFPQKHHQSYANTFHGGLQSVLLDSCMVQALRSLGIIGRTSKLKIRYKNQVELEQEIKISAEVIRSKNKFFVVEAQLTQNGKMKTTASGIFRKFDR